MKRFNVILIVFLVLLLSGIGFNKYLSQQAEKPSESQFELLTMPVDRGWGYEIWINGKLYIRQDQIPAISETLPFPSKLQAQLVGIKVLDRIRKHKNPSVRIDELIQWGIVDADKRSGNP